MLKNKLYYRVPPDPDYRRFCRKATRFRPLATCKHTRKQELRRDFLRFKYVESFLTMGRVHKFETLVKMAEIKYP